MKYKEWKNKEYKYNFIKTKKYYKIKNKKYKHNIIDYYTNFIEKENETDFEMFDSNYEKDLEKYRKIKEETEKWY